MTVWPARLNTRASAGTTTSGPTSAMRCPRTRIVALSNTLRSSSIVITRALVSATVVVGTATGKRTVMSVVSAPSVPARMSSRAFSWSLPSRDHDTVLASDQANPAPSDGSTRFANPTPSYADTVTGLPIHSNGVTKLR